jgi:hypothetical protein
MELSPVRRNLMSADQFDCFQENSGDIRLHNVQRTRAYVYPMFTLKWNLPTESTKPLYLHRCVTTDRAIRSPALSPATPHVGQTLVVQ